MKIINIQQKTPEWLAWRRTGLGASDTPAILGISPYMTKRDVYFDKKGVDTVDEENKEFIFSAGDRLEGTAKKDLYELTGQEFSPICAESSFDKRFLSSIDLYNKQSQCEVKLVSRDVLKTAIEKSEIPPHHYAQVQHQMFVTERNESFWFGGLQTGECKILTIKRDTQFIASMKDQDLQFLDDLEKGIVPPLTERDYLIPDDTEILEKLAEAKMRMEASKEEFDAMKELAINTYQHNKIAGAGIKIYRSVRSGSVDYSKIPAIHNLSKEELEKYRKPGSESWTVTLKK